MSTCPACSHDLPGEFPFCPWCGSSLVAAAEERKVVSILFCDLVGHTAASGGVDPEEVRRRLALYYTRLRREIEVFGGTVEKFIGDAVMAVFGAPVAHEDDAERAVRAGLRIVEALAELNEETDGPPLRVRVGVNTGEVVVDLAASGGVGLVVGDVVNTAARIEAHGPVDGVAAGEETVRATERVFVWERLDPVVAKGKEAPVPIWRAVRPVSRFGTDVIRSTSTPLVGREIDLAVLHATFHKALAERSAHLVTVVGEPGVGKSRLVAELFAHTDALDALVRWRQGRCPPYGEGVTFWPLGEIVKAHAGVYETDAPDVAAAKLDAVLPATEERPWLRARLLPLLGLEGQGAASREELFTAWRRFLESIAEREPLVLVVEDVHWADPAMLAFVEHLADWVKGVPLLVVCTARPELYERHPGWGGGLANATTIRLAPLSDGDTTKLVATLLDQATLPADTQAQLLERAGGNPLYAEEFARMLRDGDMLAGDGAVRGEIPLPASIHGLIAARLDTLPPERKSLLQDAAVVGKVFWGGAVAAMGDRDPREVEIALHELGRKELVRPARQSSMEGDAEYGFWHALVRDVAYGQIPRAGRAARHLAAAAWLEERAGARAEDVGEVLAHHTREALALARATGDAELARRTAPVAAHWSLLAGTRAAGLDTGKALELLSFARETTPPDDPLRPLVELRWGDAARQAGRWREAAEALSGAAAAFESRGDFRRASEALRLASNARINLGGLDAADLRRAIALVEDDPGPELVAALAELASYQVVTLEEYARSIETANRALDLAERLGLPPAAKAIGFRGLARCSLGDRGGLEDFDRAFAFALERGDGREAAITVHNLGGIRWTFDGPDAAIAQYRESTAFAAGRGIAPLVQAGVAEALAAYVAAGRLGEAVAEHDAALGGVALATPRHECQLRAGHAVALAELGRPFDPAPLLTFAAGRDDSFIDAVAAWGALPALLAAGALDTAAAVLGRVEARAHTEYAPLVPGLARAAFALGDGDGLRRVSEGMGHALPVQQHAHAAVRALAAELAGRLPEAAVLHADAARRWDGFGARWEEAHALLGQARALAAAGDSANAHEPLARACTLFADMGALPRVAECGALLPA